MMTVNFMPNEVTTYLQSRRGRSVFRKMRIDPGVHQAIYNALPQSALEVADATGHVWSRADVKECRGRITLDFQGPPKKVFDPLAYNRKKKADAAKIKAAEDREADKARQMKEKNNEGTDAPKSSPWPKTKDADVVQPVVGERGADGKTIQRPVHLQVPLVGQGDARLGRKEERGSKSSPDGLHSSDDEQGVLDD